MGMQDGGLVRRARQLAPLAALAGVAAAGAAYRRRRRTGRISPERSLAGPPIRRDPPQVEALVAQLSTALEPSPEAAPVPAVAPTADRPPLVRRGVESAAPTAAIARRSDDAVATPAATPAASVGSAAAVGTVTDVPSRRSGDGGSTRNGDAASPAGTGDDHPNGEAAAAPAASAPIAARAPAPTPVPPPPPPLPGARAADVAPAPPPPPSAPATPRPDDRVAAAGTESAGGAGTESRGPGVVARQVAAMRRHRVRLVAGLVVVALGIGASTALAGIEDDDPDTSTESASSSDDGSSSRSTGSSAGDPATTVTVRPVAADDAFAVVAERLTTAGTFRFQGEARATDVSAARPMMWLAVEATVRGEVDLAAGRAHEVAEADGGRVSETIVDGTAVWGRRADDAATAAGLPYGLVPELSRPGDGPAVRGFAQLPGWLAAATGAVEIEPAPEGRRFQATVPAAVFGPVERGRSAEDIVVVITVDDDVTPRRVELATASSDHLRIVLDLTAHGAPVVIVPPAAPTD